jgi:O-acetyl-ADP-ribose deacetylase (regulator of RNase III)
VITSPGQIDVKHIIHTVGPIYNKELPPQDNVEELISTVKSVLRQANYIGCKSIAFPAISGGYNGYPPDLCAEALFSAIKEWSDEKIMGVGETI